jgi:hypothetical protein
MDNQEFRRVAEGAFINTNNRELDAYKMARQRVYREKELKERVDSLESEVAQLKQILLKHIVG